MAFQKDCILPLSTLISRIHQNFQRVKRENLTRYKVKIDQIKLLVLFLWQLFNVFFFYGSFSLFSLIYYPAFSSTAVITDNGFFRIQTFMYAKAHVEFTFRLLFPLRKRFFFCIFSRFLSRITLAEIYCSLVQT